MGLTFLLAHHPGALGPIDHLGFKTVASVMGAALLDGMNPTALGVLLLILWQGIRHKRPTRKTAFYYLAGIIATYLVAGILLREVYLDFGPNLFIQGFQTLLALFLFLSGLSELVSAVRPSGERLMRVPEFVSRTLDRLGNWVVGEVAFVVGVVVGFIELFATGAIYLTFVQAITYDPTAPWWVLVTFMAIYLAVFSVPMLALLVYEPLVEGLTSTKALGRGTRIIRGVVGGLFMLAAGFIAASAYVTVSSTTNLWWF